MAALHQFLQPGAVLAIRGTVADQCTAGGEEGDAAQFRQRALQGAHQHLLLFAVTRRLDHRQQVQGDLCAQGHVQADLFSQVGTVVDGVLLLVFLVLLQLVEQLPEQ